MTVLLALIVTVPELPIAFGLTEAKTWPLSKVTVSALIWTLPAFPFPDVSVIS